jgi:hypothetical protein
MMIENTQKTVDTNTERKPSGMCIGFGDKSGKDGMINLFFDEVIE